MEDGAGRDCPRRGRAARARTFSRVIRTPRHRGLGARKGADGESGPSRRLDLPAERAFLAPLLPGVVNGYHAILGFWRWVATCADLPRTSNVQRRTSNFERTTLRWSFEVRRSTFNQLNRTGRGEAPWAYKDGRAWRIQPSYTLDVPDTDELSRHRRAEIGIGDEWDPERLQNRF